MINRSGPPKTVPGYLSYLLRVWHTHSAGGPVWRVSLENPLTREIVRFDSLSGLCAFLQGQTGADALDNEADEDGPPATAW